jgi:hypothetical protein
MARINYQSSLGDGYVIENGVDSASVLAARQIARKNKLGGVLKCAYVGKDVDGGLAHYQATFGRPGGQVTAETMIFVSI